jgi:adenosylhomocysteine nucleosidase
LPPLRGKETSMIGIVCGMASEAHCITRAPHADRYSVRVSGASAARAACHATALADAGARILISFGLSGALDPACTPGQLLLPPAAVLPDGERIDSDPDILQALMRAAGECEIMFGGPPLTDAIAGSDGIIGSGEAKSALRRRTGAAAVDMESHAVALVARERGAAFAAIRAIADPANRSIPETAMAGLAPDGTTRPFHVILALMGKPQDLPALIRLGRDAGAGLATLRGAAFHLLPVL